MARQKNPRETLTQPATTVKTKDWRGVIVGCVIICVLGVAARHPLLTKGGFPSDLGFFASWANAIQEHGLTNVYHESRLPANYPVGFMHILNVFNKCASPFEKPVEQWNEKNIEKPFKVFLCAADVVITFCLILGVFWLGASARGALFSGACYILNPAVIMVTGSWGQTNALAAGFVVAALILLCTRYWPIAYVLAAIGCNTKLQVVPLLGLLPLATVLLHHRPDWKRHFKAVLLGTILFLLTTLLLFSPFIFTGTAGKALSVGYSSHFESDPALNRNAWNPWYVCIPPDLHISSVPPLLVQFERRAPWLAPIVGFLTYFHISVLLFFTVAVVPYFCLILRPSKQCLFFAASVVAVAFFFLMTKIHERYLLDAIPLLLLAAAFDPRALGLCAVASIISVLNVRWSLDLLAPAGVLVLGLAFVRTTLVILAPQATVRWPWEIALRRKPWLNLPVIAYVIAGCFWLAFSCPWSLWFSNLTRPNTLYFDELELQGYRSKTYCPFRPYSDPNNQILVVEGRHADRGLAFSTDTLARFSIPRGYNSFHTTVGISDNIPENSDLKLVFTVLLDKRTVFRSEVLYPRSPALPVDILLEQADSIALVVTNINKEGQIPDSENCGYAVWMNARIQKDSQVTDIEKNKK